MGEFNDRVEILLDKRKLKRSDLAKGTQLPESTIRGWQLEGKNPNLTAAVKVAKYLNVSLDYLACGEDSNELDIAERELLCLFRMFDNRDKNTLLDLARTLKNHYSSSEKESISGA